MREALACKSIYDHLTRVDKIINAKAKCHGRPTVNANATLLYHKCSRGAIALLFDIQTRVLMSVIDTLF